MPGTESRADGVKAGCFSGSILAGNLGPGTWCDFQGFEAEDVFDSDPEYFHL
jgi:hypothetical protein